MNENPLFWTQKLSQDLCQADQIPLLGSLEPFPWQELSLLLRKNLSLDQLSVEAKEPKWRDAGEIFDGFDPACHHLHFLLSPLKGDVSVLVSKQDLLTLSSYLLLDESMALKMEETFLEGFKYFLAVEVLQAIDQLRFFRDISPQIQEKSTPANHAGLCLDLLIVIDESRSISLRIISSEDLIRSLRQHFAGLAKKLNQEALKTTDLRLGFEIAKTSLSLEEWKNINEGDFIVLDHIYDSNDDQRSYLCLTVNGKRACMASKTTDGKIKVADLGIEKGSNEEQEVKEETQEVSKRELIEDEEILEEIEDEDLDFEEDDFDDDDFEFDDDEE